MSSFFPEPARKRTTYSVHFPPDWEESPTLWGLRSTDHMQHHKCPASFLSSQASCFKKYCGQQKYSAQGCRKVHTDHACQQVQQVQRGTHKVGEGLGKCTQCWEAEGQGKPEARESPPGTPPCFTLLPQHHVNKGCHPCSELQLRLFPPNKSSK